MRVTTSTFCCIRISPPTGGFHLAFSASDPPLHSSLDKPHPGKIPRNTCTQLQSPDLNYLNRILYILFTREGAPTPTDPISSKTDAHRSRHPDYPTRLLRSGLPLQHSRLRPHPLRPGNS